MYELSKEAAAQAKADNFATRLLKNQAEEELSDQEVGNLTGNLISGGVDTTSSTLITYILAMCVFQDVQCKAQKELDRVVGHDRSPNFEGRKESAIHSSNG